jgi:hypothetical protein
MGYNLLHSRLVTILTASRFSADNYGDVVTKAKGNPKISKKSTRNHIFPDFVRDEQNGRSS